MTACVYSVLTGMTDVLHGMLYVLFFFVFKCISACFVMLLIQILKSVVLYFDFVLCILKCGSENSSIELFLLPDCDFVVLLMLM